MLYLDKNAWTRCLKHFLTLRNKRYLDWSWLQNSYHIPILTCFPHSKQWPNNASPSDIGPITLGDQGFFSVAKLRSRLGKIQFSPRAKTGQSQFPFYPFSIPSSLHPAQTQLRLQPYSIPSDRQFSSNFDFSAKVMIQMKCLMQRNGGFVSFGRK